MADQSDITIKGLQGHNQQRSSSDDQQHHSDDSDIFLKVAREEDKRQTPQVALGRSDSRKVSHASFRLNLDPRPSLCCL